MKFLRRTIALFLGKGIFFVTRTLKIGGGSAAPGLYALKIDPTFIEDICCKIPQSVIITGTNGKTTTAKILAHLAQKNNLKVLRNSTGSNLERGIASTLIQNFSFFNLFFSNFEKKYDLAIWELDEAVFVTAVKKLKPSVVVFLNVFRDQLDRFGEVNTIISKWCQTLERLDSKTQVFINGDDDNLAILKNCFSGKVKSFGVEKHKIKGELSLHRKQKLKHDFKVTNLKLKGLSGSEFTFSYFDKKQKIAINVPGIYHVYDFAAALSAAVSLGIDDKKFALALQNYSPAFGRVEKFTAPSAKDEEKEGYIFLIKNPTGATEVFRTLQNELNEDDTVLFALNDNLADGTDVSWIWDAQFEQLVNENTKARIFASGSRAEDLAVRIKYAGFDTQNIHLIKDLEKAFEQAKNTIKGRLFILPTYTAMLELQKILAKKGIKQHYWEES